MKRVLVFQHVAYEPLGTLHELLKGAGFRIRYANFGRAPAPEVDVSRYDGLVVLGGPMGVYERDRYPHLTDEMSAIRAAVEAGKPVLGICLGAQLIAGALGADVSRHPETEIGWHELSLTDEGARDPLLGQLAARETIFQWHGDSFQLPKGAVWLARSAICAHQAFRFGDHVYGFQFHLEVDAPLIERWLTVPEHAPVLARLGGPAVVDKIRADTAKHLGRQAELGRLVFSRYIETFSTKRRTIVLGSGHK